MGKNIKIECVGHNPYFSGNFFAIQLSKMSKTELVSHNPYFSGNFFAIKYQIIIDYDLNKSQSLF